MSPWMWLLWGVVLAVLILVLWAAVAGIAEAQRLDRIKRARALRTDCARCGHPYGEPWPADPPTERTP